MNSWTLKYEDFADKPLNNLATAIDKCKGIALSELKILDLVHTELRSGHGVYVFKTSKPLYIGKATSRSFIGRIPVHFDIGPDEWLNTFLKSYVKPKWTKEEAKTKTRDDYRIELEKLIQEDPHVIAITFKTKPNSDESAASLETILQSYYLINNKKKKPEANCITSKLVLLENNLREKRKQIAKNKRMSKKKNE